LSFIEVAKRKNKLHLDPKCPFEAVKRTKHDVSGPEMSFCNRQKDKTRCIRARNVFLKPSKGQNTMYPGPKCPFVTVKRTKHAVSGSEMSFWTCQKDKTRFIRARNVFLKPSKGQNTFHPSSKCLFEAVKRTKHVTSGSEMSFWSRQKDKTRCFRVQNVFLNLPKGQNTLRLDPKCPFEPAKRTKKGSRLGPNILLNLSKGQKESRLDQNVFLKLPHGQNKTLLRWRTIWRFTFVYPEKYAPADFHSTVGARSLQHGRLIGSSN